jgi:hypothetical protein
MNWIPFAGVALPRVVNVTVTDDTLEGIILVVLKCELNPNL